MTDNFAKLATDQSCGMILTGGGVRQERKEWGQFPGKEEPRSHI